MIMEVCWKVVENRILTEIFIISFNFRDNAITHRHIRNNIPIYILIMIDYNYISECKILLF